MSVSDHHVSRKPGKISTEGNEANEVFVLLSFNLLAAREDFADAGRLLRLRLRQAAPR